MMIPTSIRLPDDLKSWIEAQAMGSGQSSSAYIIGLLRDAMKEESLITRRYRAIFRHGGSYFHASRESPDQHEGPYKSKEGAWQNARAMLLSAGMDPGAVLDLTGVPNEELKEYLR